MAQNEVLFTLNKKAFQAPDYWSVVSRLQEFCSGVLVTDQDSLEVNRLRSARAWVVAGGDGTLHWAVNTLLSLPREERVPICYLPSGTGNDFARVLGVHSRSPVELVEEAFSPGADFPWVTVGRCDDRYFINMATGGAFAEVTPSASPQLKSVLGTWSYALQGLGTLLERKEMRLRADGGDWESALGFFLANGRYAGGGIQIVAEADPEEPSLEYFVIPPLTTPELVALGLELQKEKPEFKGGVGAPVRVTKLELEFQDEVQINLDGEPVAKTRAVFSVEPDGLRIFKPRQRENAPRA